MIKLIATDMDGTLLDSEGHLPKELPQILDALEARGVLFCAASGRPYGSLLREFESVADKIVFICENGALIMRGGKRVFLDAIDPEYLPEIVAASRTMEGIYPVVCRAGTAIVEESAPEDFIRVTRQFCSDMLVVPDLMEHTHYDDVCKVAFYDEGDAQQHELPLLQQAMPQELTVTLSGYSWVDVMKPGVHKGRALTVLMAQLGITRDEAMAFGDYLNDKEMLQSVTHSYAMENAHPQLKAVAANIAPSNDNHGVIAVIREKVLEEHCD